MSSPAVTQASGAPLVTLTTTANTAVLTSGVVAYNAPGGQGLVIRGTVSGATGTGVTSTQVRVYRGVDTTGTQIGGTLQEAQGAGSFYSMDFNALDTAPAASGQYTVAVQMVGATGNSTATFALISAEPANAAGV